METGNLPKRYGQWCEQDHICKTRSKIRRQLDWVWQSSSEPGLNSLARLVQHVTTRRERYQQMLNCSSTCSHNDIGDQPNSHVDSEALYATLNPDRSRRLHLSVVRIRSSHNSERGWNCWIVWTFCSRPNSGRLELTWRQGCSGAGDAS